MAHLRGGAAVSLVLAPETTGPTCVSFADEDGWLVGRFAAAFDRAQLRMRYRAEGDDVVLADLKGYVNRHGFLIHDSLSRHTITAFGEEGAESADGTFHLSADACAEELGSEVHAFDSAAMAYLLDSIVEVVSAPPPALPSPDRFGRVLRRGGTLFMPSEGLCETWRVEPERGFRPSHETLAAGALVKREGAHRTSFGFAYGGFDMTLTGPNWSGPDGEGGFGCAERLDVRHASDHAEVAGNPWYLSARACAAALEAGIESGIGGC